jgi:hypothetical protein
MRSFSPEAARRSLGIASAQSGVAVCALVLSAAGIMWAQAPLNVEFQEYAEKLRANALRSLQPQVVLPIRQRASADAKYPWKLNIVTGVFAIRRASAWDPEWEKHYGGFDNPRREARNGFAPAKFRPALNPFYVALPYNDVDANGTKPEARALVPWFADTIARDGQSVLQGRWIAIRKNRANAASILCCAQWSDCGPGAPEQGDYVFGNALPRWNANMGQGLSVSAAVRDFLELRDRDVTDWKFVEAGEVPPGPWTEFGDKRPEQTAHRSLNQK